LCIFAINAGAGGNTLLSCSQPVVPSGSPYGSIDDARLGPDGLLTLRGWTVDPDTDDPTRVHVYVDGVGTDIGPASGNRPDVAASLPLYGSQHGFTWSRQLTDAPHSVCVFAINEGPGGNTLLWCGDLQPPSGSPIGVIDVAAGGPDGTYALSGWTVDPDVSDPIEVHAYIDGVGRNLGPTNVDRLDVAVAFPGYGARHGYAAMGSGLAPGRHSMCVFGINVGAGSNTLLQCRPFDVPGGPPFGVVDDVVEVSGNRIRANGWTLDPDTAGATEVHVYVDGAGYNIGEADGNRPDIAAAFPGYGAAHGFSWTSPGLASGSHSVCVFAINAGVGSNTLVNCRTVDV
jgi:hypothetical protein